MLYRALRHNVRDALSSLGPARIRGPQGVEVGEQVILHPSNRVHDGVRVAPRASGRSV